MTAKRFDTAQSAALAARYLEGESCDQIAASLGCSRSAVASAITRAGVPIRSQTANSESVLLGNTFGRWTVQAFSHRIGKVRYWICRCSCGVEKPVCHWSLVQHKSTSCGCFRQETNKGRPPSLSPEQDAELARRYALGESTTSLARDIGVNDHTVAIAVRRAGGEIRRALPFTPEQEMEMAQAYSAGRFTTQIAVDFNTSAARVRLAILRRGGVMRPRCDMTPAALAKREQEVAAKQQRKAKREEIASRRLFPLPMAKFRTKRSWVVNVNYFHKIDTPEKARFLGMLAADGCVSSNRHGLFRLSFALKTTDRTYIEAFRDAIGSDAPIVERDTSTSRLATIHIFDQQFCQDLVRHGVVPRKSLILQPWRGPEELMRFWWAGMVDGDGWVGKRKPLLGLCTGSRQIAESFADYLWHQIGVRFPVKDYWTKTGRLMHAVCPGNIHVVQAIARLFYADLQGSIPLQRKLELAEVWLRSKPVGCYRARLPLDPQRCRSVGIPLDKRDSLTAEIVVAQYEKLGSWSAVAAHFGFKANSFVYIRKQLGLDVGPACVQRSSSPSTRQLTLF